MFLLTRCALCIGLVAAAASGLGGARSAVERGAEAAGEACLASSACLRAGTAALASGGPALLQASGGGPAAGLGTAAPHAGPPPPRPRIPRARVPRSDTPRAW